MAPISSDALARLTTALADRLRIIREVGSGGMATVYLAEDLKHHRKVAIKVLTAEVSGVIGAERFVREIEILAGLNHPHIVPLYESGEADGIVYYVMPYIEGESLRNRLLRERQLPVDEAVSIARQVASALTFSHARGVVHRDIKPENILLSDGQAVVADFGIARAMAAAAGERLTETGVVVGTPIYMAPEQIAGDQELDGRTDVYSLACVLYEMLAGEPPYTGPTAQVIVARHLGEAVPQVRRLRSQVPDHIESAITRGLAKIQADRFDTAKDFVESLGTGSMATLPKSLSGRGSWLSWRLFRRAGAIALVPATILILLVAFDAGGLRHRLMPGDGAPTAALGSVRSIAVLPFDNVGADPEEEYFSDGLSDELITALSHLRSVRVAARTSAFQFKGQARDIREIAHALNVATVLVGSVRKRDDRIRVTAQLIDASTGLDLWSEAYDERALSDIFDVQSDLALRITHALEANLSPAERERIRKKPTENVEAYTLYLKGRYAWDRRGQGLFTAIDYFNQAIALDPNFAQAYAGVASAYPPLGVFGYVHPREARERMREAATRAAELDDGLAEVHTALAAYLQVYEWDWAAAEREYLRAIEIDPDYATAHVWYATLLMRMRRFSEGEAEQHRAIALDPLAPVAALPTDAIAARRYDEAETALRELIKTHPDLDMAHKNLGEVYVATGQLDEAIEEFQRAIELAGASSVPKAQLARALALSGRRDEAKRLIDELRAETDTSGIYHPIVAIALIAMGDMDGAVQWLEKGYEQRNPALACRDAARRLCGGGIIDPDREFAKLPREDPRVDALLDSIGFPR